jgi:hypothetical protein
MRNGNLDLEATINQSINQSMPNIFGHWCSVPNTGTTQFALAYQTIEKQDIGVIQRSSHDLRDDRRKQVVCSGQFQCASQAIDDWLHWCI